jgi:hypothetical protein
VRGPCLWSGQRLRRGGRRRRRRGGEALLDGVGLGGLSAQPSAGRVSREEPRTPREPRRRGVVVAGGHGSSRAAPASGEGGHGERAG